MLNKATLQGKSLLEVLRYVRCYNICHTDNYCIQYQHDGSMCFSEQDYSDLQIDVSSKTVSITTHFFGLTGAKGCLPQHYSETFLQQLKANDFSLKDFYRLFESRLQQLYMMPAERFSTTVSADSIDNNFIDQYQRCLLNLSSQKHFSLQNIAFFSSPLMSSRKLQKILQANSGLRIVVKENVSYSEKIPNKFLNCLDHNHSKNMLLGQQLILGVHCEMAHVYSKIEVLAESHKHYCELIEDLLLCNKLKKIASSYMGNAFKFFLEIVLPIEQKKSMCLSKNSSLGRSSYIIV